jgi:hypothetical protein
MTDEQIDAEIRKMWGGSPWPYYAEGVVLRSERHIARHFLALPGDGCRMPAAESAPAGLPIEAGA